VVLTHISDELDADEARQRAAKAFGGDVDVAEAGATYAVDRATVSRPIP
jgi:hypothetical protein